MRQIRITATHRPARQPLCLLTSLCLSACAALLAPPAQAANAWEPMRTGQGREDVSTWVRTVEGMSVKAFKGQAEVHHTVPVVLAVLADIKGLPNWIYQCQHAEQLAGLSGDHTYARFRGIWPASDRDVLMRTTISQQDDGSVLVESRQASGHPEQDGFVRMPYLNNSFRLVPLKGGWTRLTFETQVDLGGMVPAWIANMVATKAPLVTIEGMQKQMKLPRYQIKSIDELPTYYLKGQPLVLPEQHLKVDAATD